jgi:hypothetical protein
VSEARQNPREGLRGESSASESNRGGGFPKVLRLARMGASEWKNAIVGAVFIKGSLGFGAAALETFSSLAPFPLPPARVPQFSYLMELLERTRISGPNLFY